MAVNTELPIKKVEVTETGVSTPVDVPVDTASAVRPLLENNISEFDNTNIKSTNIPKYGFYYDKYLTKINLAGIKRIREYSFFNCNNATELTLSDDIECIEANALSNLAAVSTLNLPEFTKLKILMDGAFAGIGSNRSDYATNPLVFDFRKSLINNIDYVQFNQSPNIIQPVSSSFSRYYSRNIKYLLPKTMYSLGDIQLSNDCKLYFTSPFPLYYRYNSSGGSWYGKVYVPYNSLYKYKTARGFSRKPAQVYGFSEENHFANNETLPAYTAEGYALTWYSNEDMTTTVSICTNPSQMYYCSMDTTTKVAYGLTDLFVYNGSLTITNTTKNKVVKCGDGIEVGDVLSISATPDSGMSIDKLTINGTTISNNSTYTMTAEDIKICCVCWDGITHPVDTFNNTSWAMIKVVAQANGAKAVGWSVGDTKEISINNTTYHIRISDLNYGRYVYGDNTRLTSMTFEMVELWPTKYKMNAVPSDQAGGYIHAQLKTTVNTTIYDTLPDDVRAVIEEIYVNGRSGHESTQPSTSNDLYYDVTGARIVEKLKLFIIDRGEVGDTSNSAYYNYNQPFDYYTIHNTAADRIKYFNGTAAGYWTRANEGTSSSNDFIEVGNNGTIYTSNASYEYGVALCFAL